MPPTSHRALKTAGILLAALVLSPTGSALSEERLSFDVNEGTNLNSFLREGPVAAHLLLRSGWEPRILVAFPAGNSGVGLWFSRASAPVSWTLRDRPQPLITRDARGRALYGMSAEARVTGARALRIKQAVLSSVRVLRDYQALGTFPTELTAAPMVHGSGIAWARERLDGAPGYRLSVQVTHGLLRGDRIIAASDGEIGLKIIALSGEAPLTPLTANHLLNDHARDDAAARNALTFLSYKEKFLAGSWRFNTYFGRDTLMSVRLLMPALTPEAVNAGLGSVLSRLSPQGEVAHEEDIGEFAILDHLRAGDAKSDAPTFDYNMIDATFMLAPVIAQWLLDDERGRLHAAAFLKSADAHAEKSREMAADLLDNFRFVLQASAKFAGRPSAANLIALKAGRDAGQWRDSNDGLGGGRTPYDVNAVFVPSALEAISRFLSAGLLDPYLSSEDRVSLAQAASFAKVWRDKAPPLFDVHVSSETATRDIRDYAAFLKVPNDDALRSVDDLPVSFHAVSLNADSQPIPIVHSDEGFALLFTRPSPAILDRTVAALMRPFPAGLLTPVGVLVANPVYAAPSVQARLTRNAYHGTVVWSWQQAVLAAGLQRQLELQELPPASRALLHSAQTQLWSAIDAAYSMRNSELWSWNFANGRYAIAPFGASAADA
ncbi:MAG TPA: hypothetical protein VN815_14720, partial [Steroidobacteraceae bacterium]|nr:hypothetical protein [Steroidobacteraceae bacterium]